MNVSTSLILTTFNGTKYLLPLLDSIRSQIQPFDEIIIVDDCSTDGTVELVEKYIKSNNLTRCYFIKNKSNLGWKKNFKFGFNQASGKYIFPCDQDDIWHSDKCKKMVAIMEERPDIDLLVSNFNLFFSEIDKGSTAYQTTKKRMINDGSIKIMSFTPKWPYVSRPGCTFCFRKSFYDEIKDEWDINYPHDSILWRYAMIKGTLAILNEPLIDFRRHGDNASTVKIRTRSERIQALKDYLYFHRKALNYPLKERDKNTINKGIEFLKKRRSLYETRNIFKIIPLVVRYRNFYLTPKGILGDLFFVFNNKQNK